MNTGNPFLSLNALIVGYGIGVIFESLAAVRAGKARIAYGVSKAGAERMALGLAEYVKGYNIAVNSLAPVGITDTATERKFLRMDQEERFSNLLDCYPKAWLSGRLLEAKKMGLHEVFGPVANTDTSLSAGKTCVAEEAFEYKRTPGIF